MRPGFGGRPEAVFPMPSVLERTGRLARPHPSSPLDQKIATRNNAAAAATTTTSCSSLTVSLPLAITPFRGLVEQATGSDAGA
jgi:hypothetical protein